LRSRVVILVEADFYRGMESTSTGNIGSLPSSTCGQSNTGAFSEVLMQNEEPHPKAGDLQEVTIAIYREKGQCDDIASRG
jgi:hypothetical protein